MTGDLLAAGDALANVLEAENAALAALDMPRALALFARKAERLRQFRGALSAASAQERSAPDHAARADRLACVERLRALAEDNRRLLERAMVVQGRLIATIARAIPRAHQGYPCAPREDGRQDNRVGAVTLSARV